MIRLQGFCPSLGCITTNNCPTTLNTHNTNTSHHKKLRNWSALLVWLYSMFTVRSHDFSVISSSNNITVWRFQSEETGNNPQVETLTRSEHKLVTQSGLCPMSFTSALLLNTKNKNLLKVQPRCTRLCCVPILLNAYQWRHVCNYSLW